ncbi:MAG: hypothetical protein R2941_06145 [Desulfobacterales bacterium]
MIILIQFWFFAAMIFAFSAECAEKPLSAQKSAEAGHQRYSFGLKQFLCHKKPKWDQHI